MKTGMREIALQWAEWCQAREHKQLEAFLRLSAPALAGLPSRDEELALLRRQLMEEKIQHQKLRSAMERGEYYEREEVVRLIGEFVNDMNIRWALRVLGCKLIGRKPVQ